MRKILDSLEYLLYLTVDRGLRLLPHRRTGRLGQVFGYLLFLVAMPFRRLAASNLRLVLPELDAAARRRTVWACFGQWGRVLLEARSICRFRREDLTRLFDVVGGEFLEAAQAEGRGVMLLSAHYGAFEMGIHFLGPLLDRLHILVRPPDNPLDRSRADRNSQKSRVGVDRSQGRCTGFRAGPRTGQGLRPGA